MQNSIEVSAQATVQITRAAPLFDRLVEVVLSEWQTGSATSRRDTAEPAREEIARRGLRERLDWFFPEFRDLYFNLLREQLGPDLEQLIVRMQQLGQKMASSLDGAPRGSES